MPEKIYDAIAENEKLAQEVTANLANQLRKREEETDFRRLAQQVANVRQVLEELELRAKSTKELAAPSKLDQELDEFLEGHADGLETACRFVRQALESKEALNF